MEMECKINGVEFIYEKELYKINVMKGEECLDCLDLDYMIHGSDEFDLMCRRWIEENR